jgi:glucosamine--fructose-6-phosphate aminotransferase (isomerizing)
MTKMLEEILQQPEVLRKIEDKNKDTLTKIANEVKQKAIVNATFAARGTSDHASIYGQYLLAIHCGIVSSLAMPSTITLYGAKLNLEKTLVIGVSQSGKAADALAVLEQGNECGAITVAVTNDENSPMAKTAKYHLFCNAGLEVSVAATKTFTSQLYLMALLTAYISDNKTLISSLNSVPSKLDELIKSVGTDIEKNVNRMRYIREGFCLSRGISYAIALEASLKIQETCYIKMKGYAVSDFYHGPMAQLDPDVPVILYAPSGASANDHKDMIEKILSIGAAPLIVTCDSKLKDLYENVVVLPATGVEETDVYMFAVFAQLFAEKLSVSKGLNPDAPRLLNKVTITR